jgi:high affinity Mn2+ porin
MLVAKWGAGNLKAYAMALAVGTGVSAQAVAADFSAKAARSLDPWSGYYVGGSVGYGTGSLGNAVNPLLLQGLVFTPSVPGLTGSLQTGANRRIGSWVIGAEADSVFAGPRDPARIVPRRYDSSVDVISSVRGRIGYAIGPLLPYATAGVAFGHFHVLQNDAGGEFARQTGHWQAGWTAGLGIEALLGGGWSGRIEYRHAEFGGRAYPTGDPARPSANLEPRLDLVMLGLNYRLGDFPAANPAIVTPPALPDGWMVHGQFTFLPQAYPRFRSPYQGPNSLPGGGQGRETFTTSAFLGWTLWDGGEFLFNPELAQGFGLNTTLGLAGFSNGEAQKGGAPYPRFRPQRYLLRQTFELGGGQEELPDSATQIGGKRDIDRISISVGRFAVGDFFDGNAYAKDPRADFMNWALWASAAYDFPADLPGFTRGGVVELNRRDFAVRAGLFQVPSAPNSDLLTFKSGGVAAEFEGRYALWDRAGKLRIGAFANRGNSASYRGAITAATADPFTDINDLVPALRRERSKTGFYLNAEQQLMPDLGAFARFSMNDGKSEILSFTDIDRSVSGGLSIKGRSWGRPADTIGIGGAINGLSAAHRDFLAAGGLGLLIGDGRLTYGTERIFETYYAYAINRHFTVTADYQLIVNPAYNSDRGPVSIFSARLHGEF